MDLPKCKICGEKHRLGSCDPFDYKPVPPKRTATINVTVKDMGRAEPAKFDRVAYQREYMREYRKRKK